MTVVPEQTAATAHAVETTKKPEVKRAVAVARRIGEDIAARGWPIGESIGSEQDLMERYGVSRAILREAVRLLEHQTVATMRRGPAGGLIVQEPDATPTLTAMTMFLEHIGTSYENIIDARTILEPVAAAWAAEALTEDEIADLRDALTAEHERAGPMDSTDGSVKEDIVHAAIARASGNPVLEIFVHVLTQLTERYARVAPSVQRDERSEILAAVRAAHAAIVDSILCGNPGQAQHRAEVHLHAMATWLVSKSGGVTTTRQARKRARTSTPTERIPGSKLAEYVSLRIRDDIIGEDVAVGDFIGSETDLLERYGVSRAVLREAIRLVEHHGIARMRRGPGGGLIATEPNPGASTESMALLLDYRRTTLAQVWAVRAAIELECVVRVAQRSTDADVVAWIEATRAANQQKLKPGSPILGKHDLHYTLAEISGNPVLNMFLRILSSLYRRHLPPDVNVDPSTDMRRDLVRAHDAILDAIEAGDAGLARHRMARHLSALGQWWL
ncbi:FCD domain-containing protein [Nocardia sp. NPDC005366]|uniref:FadR/GntR family transcriptional regulator n=1 Tax=Nocardia sp. NPDC005366 TaxID=3156878 RepID=UPI0033B8F17E